MSNRIHALAQQLTGKANLEDCSLEEVRHIAQRYPYFAPAQFLLLQKLRLSGPAEEAESQYQKAVLFYPDPLQFEYFISSGNFYTEEESPVYVQPEIPALQTAIVEAAVTHEPEDAELADTETNLAEEDTDVTDVNDPVETFEETSVESELPNEVAAGAEIETTTIAEEKEHVEDAPANEVADISQGEQPLTEEAKLSEPVAIIPVAESIAPVAELSFEPYHTVDYFASQGIKISQEETPKDKLGKQMKSFTEWLKTMKRLPATQLTEAVETTAEKKVETMASRSVTESDVVTETMAEVWARQGNREKALDIYNKLVLLNPSKKAYFAAKIENLKQS